MVFFENAFDTETLKTVLPFQNIYESIYVTGCNLFIYFIPKYPENDVG